VFEESDGGCIPLKNHGGVYFTASVPLGQKHHIVNLILDTCSSEILIDAHKTTSSTSFTGKHKVLSYGSGDVVAAEATDIMQIGTSAESHKLYIIEETTFDFEIEGILPLGSSSRETLHMPSFSVCFSKEGGMLKLGATGAHIPTSNGWVATLSDVGILATAGHVPDSTGLTGRVAIDTGTSLICAPASQLTNLFKSICSVWSKCEGDTAVSFINSVHKHCSNGLPDIQFKMTGGSVQLTGKDYVVHFNGRCTPAFDIFDIWILGQPLFYAYKVDFNANNQKIAFTRGACGGCSSDLEQENNIPKLREDSGVRRLSGPPRRPTRTGKSHGHTILSDAEKAAPDRGDMEEIIKYMDLSRALKWHPF